MGRKPQKKSNVPKAEPAKKLSAQKRNELDQLIDRLYWLGFKVTQAPAELWNEYTEIQGILDRIQGIESTLKAKGSAGKSRVATIETFCKWCEENGGQYDGVKISEFAGYELGLEAAKTIKTGDLIITVPKRMIISEECLAEQLAPVVAEIPMLDSMTNVKLAFGLLLEKLKIDSFWKPYLDLLPERHSTVMYFSVNEMQELKGSTILAQALNQCKSIARQYAFIQKCIQKVNAAKFGADSIGRETFEILKEKFTYELYSIRRIVLLSVSTKFNPKISNSHINKSHGLEKTHILCHYLVVGRLFEDKEYNEALEILHSVDMDDMAGSMLGGTDPSCDIGGQNLWWMDESTKNDVLAYICFLKGKVLEVMDSRSVAMDCYVQALQRSVYCSEALDALVQHEMLMAWEEKDLMQHLPFNQQCTTAEGKLIRKLYESKLEKYYESVDPVSTADQTPIGNVNSLQSIPELAERIVLPKLT